MCIYREIYSKYQINNNYCLSKWLQPLLSFFWSVYFELFSMTVAIIK